MLGWWKAVDPGDFKMGSVEFWRSAELGTAQIPPRSAPPIYTDDSTEYLYEYAILTFIHV